MARVKGITEYDLLDSFDLPYQTFTLNIDILDGAGSVTASTQDFALYFQVGKLVHGLYRVQVTLSGADSTTALRADLPVTAFDTGTAAANVGGGYYYNGSNAFEVGNTIFSDPDELRIFPAKYGNTFVNANRTCWGNFIYRAA